MPICHDFPNTMCSTLGTELKTSHSQQQFKRKVRTGPAHMASSEVLTLLSALLGVSTSCKTSALFQKRVAEGSNRLTLRDFAFAAPISTTNAPHGGPHSGDVHCRPSDKTPELHKLPTALRGRATNHQPQPQFSCRRSSLSAPRPSSSDNLGSKMCLYDTRSGS